MRTFDEAWEDEPGDPSRDCEKCKGSGFAVRGFDVGIPKRPDGEQDEIVQWIARVTACTHPEASRTVRGGTDDSRTTVVGARRRPEARPAVDRDSGPGPDGAP